MREDEHANVHPHLPSWSGVPFPDGDGPCLQHLPGEIFNNNNNIPWLIRPLSYDLLHVTLLSMKKIRWEITQVDVETFDIDSVISFILIYIYIKAFQYFY